MSIDSEYKDFQLIDPDATRYEFVAGEIFGLTTYDGEQDELLVKEIIEVFSVIRSGTNFDYIVTPANLLRYSRTINLGNCLDWLEWGTSIRGAYFKDEETAARFDEVVAFLG